MQERSLSVEVTNSGDLGIWIQVYSSRGICFRGTVMANSTNYLRTIAKNIGIISGEPELSNLGQRNPGHFSQDMIRLESMWRSLKKTEDEIAADPILERVKSLMAACAAVPPDWNSNWNNACLAEQLIAGYLDGPDLTVEAERQLFKADKSKIALSAHFAEQWQKTLEVQDAPTRTKTQRAVYAKLLNERQWQDRTKRFKQTLRAEMSRKARILAVTLFFFAILPFVPWFGGGTIGGIVFTTGGGASRSHIFGLYTACSFGLLGALFSRLSAFQSSNATLDYDDLINLFQKDAFYIRLLLGMIGSMIVFYAIFGKFLDGDLFPDVETLVFDPAVKPDGNFAKLVIWCFLGGFSERLVPGFLTRTESNALKA
jgi:hypothetical protein